MRFSNINWQEYNLRPLAQKTRLSEQELFGVFDSEAGMHIAKGASTKPKNDIAQNTSKMIYRLMEGAADFEFDDEDEEDIEENGEYQRPANVNLPATMEEIRGMVDGILGQLKIEWST